MSLAGYAPWMDDTAGDWLGSLMKNTNLREEVVDTLGQAVDEDSCRIVRAAAYFLIVMGYPFLWPIDHLQEDLALAISQLKQCEEIEPERDVCDILRKEIIVLEKIAKGDHGSYKQLGQLVPDLWSNWLEAE